MVIMKLLFGAKRHLQITLSVRSFVFILSICYLLVLSRFLFILSFIHFPTRNTYFRYQYHFGSERRDSFEKETDQQLAPVKVQQPAR